MFQVVFINLILGVGQRGGALEEGKRVGQCKCAATGTHSTACTHLLLVELD